MSPLGSRTTTPGKTPVPPSDRQGPASPRVPLFSAQVSPQVRNLSPQTGNPQSSHDSSPSPSSLDMTPISQSLVPRRTRTGDSVATSPGATVISAGSSVGGRYFSSSRRRGNVDAPVDTQCRDAIGKVSSKTFLGWNYLIEPDFDDALSDTNNNESDIAGLREIIRGAVTITGDQASQANLWQILKVCCGQDCSQRERIMLRLSFKEPGPQKVEFYIPRKDAQGVGYAESLGQIKLSSQESAFLEVVATKYSSQVENDRAFFRYDDNTFDIQADQLKEMIAKVVEIYKTNKQLQKNGHHDDTYILTTKKRGNHLLEFDREDNLINVITMPSRKTDATSEGVGGTRMLAYKGMHSVIIERKKTTGSPMRLRRVIALANTASKSVGAKTVHDLSRRNKTGVLPDGIVLPYRISENEWLAPIATPLKKGSITRDNVTELAEVFDTLHSEHDVFHTDIKIDNLMLRHGKVVAIDMWGAKNLKLSKIPEFTPTTRYAIRPLTALINKLIKAHNDTEDEEKKNELKRNLKVLLTIHEQYSFMLTVMENSTDEKLQPKARNQYSSALDANVKVVTKQCLEQVADLPTEISGFSPALTTALNDIFDPNNILCSPVKLEGTAYVQTYKIELEEQIKILLNETELINIESVKYVNRLMLDPFGLALDLLKDESESSGAELKTLQSLFNKPISTEDIDVTPPLELMTDRQKEITEKIAKLKERHDENLLINSVLTIMQIEDLVEELSPNGDIATFATVLDDGRGRALIKNMIKNYLALQLGDWKSKLEKLNPGTTEERKLAETLKAIIDAYKQDTIDSMCNSVYESLEKCIPSDTKFSLEELNTTIISSFGSAISRKDCAMYKFYQESAKLDKYLGMLDVINELAQDSDYYKPPVSKLSLLSAEVGPAQYEAAMSEIPY